MSAISDFPIRSFIHSCRIFIQRPFEKSTQWRNCGAATLFASPAD